MPTHALVQVAEMRDGTLPRDFIVNTFSYRWADFTIQDAASLANNVLDAYDAHFTPASQGEYLAKVYDHEGTPPVLPMATVSRGAGRQAPATSPREVALCLSFSGGQHQPRQRGRAYMYVGKQTSAPGARPTPAAMQLLVDFGKSLHAVGGANVDWIVWSRVNRTATSISRVWCDDEWDTVRTRGRKALTRNTYNF
jgi:hypothetical protein